MACGARGPCENINRARATASHPGETPRYSRMGAYFNIHVGFPMLDTSIIAFNSVFPKLLNRNDLFSAGKGERKKKKKENQTLSIEKLRGETGS